jgi:hypothetical protein
VRRSLSVIVAVTLSAGVIATVVVSRRVAASSRRIAVHGLISSENTAFFANPRVRKEFGRHGLDVRVATATRDPDFALVANTSAPPRAIGHPSVLFSTPLVIAVPAELQPALIRAGTARRRGGIWTFDVARYLALVHDGRVPARIAAPAIESSTGMLFAALAGVAAHLGKPLVNAGDVDAVVNAVSPLFRPGAGALLVGSEAQFAAHPRPNTVLMYPDPDIASQQALESFTAVGGRARRLLATDPKLQELGAQDGLATPKPQVAGGARPDLAVMAVPPYAILEALVNRVTATIVASGAANGARKP